MASSKHSGSPPYVSITYSCGGYLMEGHRSLVDLLNFGSTGGVGGSGGAWLTGSLRLSLLSSPAPPWSSWTIGGETEAGIIRIFGDDWDSSLFFTSPTIWS